MTPSTPKARKPKYRNVKTNGYSSKREAKRAGELKLLLKAGLIRDLEEQVKFELIPAQHQFSHIERTKKTEFHRYKLVERNCVYVADFRYKDKAGKEFVEDAKGVRTDAYVIKRKLMLQKFGIRIVEV